MASAASRKPVLKFIDIGANLTDPMFRGIYHGTLKHKDDFADVMRRAWENGLQKIFITGGNLDDSKEALELAKTHPNLYSTVGCHPTRCQDFEASGDPEAYFQELKSLIDANKDKVVAVGECGLDYDRTQFCPEDIQRVYFEKQMDLAQQTKLPMFLHCRAASRDFADIIMRNRSKFSTGVVHSFTGSKDDVTMFVNLDLYIGINGCSLKTQENIDTMCTIPTERLLIETDAPWCEIRPTHAGFKSIQTQFQSMKKEKWEEGSTVKGRNEPAMITQVLEVMAAARNEDITQLASTIYENTMKVFCPSEWCSEAFDKFDLGE